MNHQHSPQRSTIDNDIAHTPAISISIVTLLLSYYLVTAMPDNDNRQSFMFFLLLTWNGGKYSELCEGFVSIPLGSPKWRRRCTVGHFLDLLVYERRWWLWIVLILSTSTTITGENEPLSFTYSFKIPLIRSLGGVFSIWHRQDASSWCRNI